MPESLAVSMPGADGSAKLMSPKTVENAERSPDIEYILRSRYD